MVEKRNPELVIPPPVAEDACTPETVDCRCRNAVLRAYRDLTSEGRNCNCALRICTRIYRYHHPEVESVTAREIVKVWVYEPSIH